MVTNSADLAIRLRRAAFNRALAEADLGAIAAILAPTAILVAGTDSAILNGRKAQIAAWKQEFSAVERTVYTRTTETIQASVVAPVAFEQGRWHGVSVASSLPLASGIYTAKWRKSGPDWVIEAEIFLTLA
jgi:ketosteroid isomerase-like protein